MPSYAIFHPYLIDISASTVSIAPVEVANVASPRRRGPADNIDATGPAQPWSGTVLRVTVVVVLSGFVACRKDRKRLHKIRPTVCRRLADLLPQRIVSVDGVDGTRKDVEGVR